MKMRNKVNNLRVALAQVNTTVGDLPGNARTILSFYERAGKAGADLVVFPEMAVTGYPPEDLLLKSAFVKDNLRALASLARAMRGPAAVVGFVDADKKGRLFNAAAVISAGAVRQICRKRDLPNYGVFDEKRYFSPGQDGPLTVINGIPVGINVCEDIWTEDGAHAAQVRAGARVLVNISSSPYDWDKYETRRRLLTRRARSGKVFVCYANRVGGQDELVFDGASLVVSPQGKIMARGKQFAEDLVLADLSVAGSGRPLKRKVEVKAAPCSKPALAPHLPEVLEQDEHILRALVLGTRDYVRKNGFEKALIGLSGGIDSALVAAVAVEALGKENVVGISMPSRFSSEGTRADARTLAKNLDIRFLEIPIEGVFKPFLDVLAPEFQGLPSGLAEENLQARIRGTILMTFSNKFGWLVLTTGNKSEIAVGYCTLYGDMSGGYAVIKDVPKTKVYDIAELINKTRGKVIPRSIIDRPPTAELRENQKDEDSLPPYPVLDPILKAYVEEHQPFTRIARAGKDTGMVKKVLALVDKSEYKRRQAPPGVKVTPRAFGKDWRLPITNRYKEF